MADLSLAPSLLNSDTEPFLFVAVGREEGERGSAPHSHARGQLFSSMRGVLTVGVESAVWIVPAIHAVWLPPHHEHWAASHGPFEGWATYIAEDVCTTLPTTPRAIRTSGLLREAVLRAADWPLEPLDAAMAHVAAVILDEIRTLPSEPLGLPMPRDPRLARIAHALVGNPADDRDLDAWARWAGASARTVSRRFVMETGFTFTAWRQRTRLLRSLELLAGGTAVTHVALDLGFSTASTFIAMFRQTFGETPAAYQRRL